jgi:hypothetical protein
MLFREIITVYSKINIDNMNAILLQNAEFLGTLAELRKAAISFGTSVCPHGATRLPLDGVSYILNWLDRNNFCTFRYWSVRMYLNLLQIKFY